MTCYFRHLQDVFKKAGIEVTKENRREIDRIIHGIVGVEYKNCSAVWKEVKKRVAIDEDDFVSKEYGIWEKVYEYMDVNSTSESEPESDRIDLRLNV